MLTWVVYDIGEDKPRTKVGKACLDSGLYRVQKSVFLGEINATALDELSLKIEDMIDKETDSVYIFPMCSGDFSKVRLLGQAFDKELVTDEILSKFF